MRHDVFAMDTFFYNSIGSYPYEARCEMVAELGYDATYHTLWNEGAWSDLPKLAKTKQKYGLDVAAVYFAIDIATGAAVDKRILEVFDTVPAGTDIEVNIVCSDAKIGNSSPEGDDNAARRLEPLLVRAAEHKSAVCVYPHINSWAERIEDGIRLCEKIDHPALKVVFCGFHWYAVDGNEPAERLGAAAPYLRSVNLCGSRRIAGRCTIEPLDCGEMDNFALLGLLHKNGYRGRIGFQGYSVGGDTYQYLKRSLATFRAMETRLDEHGNWADLDFQTTI